MSAVVGFFCGVVMAGVVGAGLFVYFMHVYVLELPHDRL